MELEHEPEIDESKAFATGFFQGAQLVSGYMKDCFRMIEDVEIKSETQHKAEHLKGLWQRAYAWMHTVGKLNNPLDFQALAIANRALLEITVDLVLLHHDETNLSGWKMHWWGFSEKLKACEQIINFFVTISRQRISYTVPLLKAIWVQLSSNITGRNIGS